MKLKRKVGIYGAILCLATLLVIPNAFSARKGLVNLDFQDADVKDVIKSISEITGKNFIMDDRVRGKITIISPTPVTIKEAYQAFLSALEIKNYTVIPGSGRTYKVVPLREAKTSAITTISETETPYGDTFITRLIAIRYISASEIVKSLKTLVSPNGTITAYSPTNTLIVTDSASNIRRLMKIIAKLDKEGSVEGVEVIPLKYASAAEVGQKLLALFPQQKAGSLLTRALRSRTREIEPAVAQSISKIIPDDRTNSLIVVANRQGLERILDIVKRLDIEVKAMEGKGRIHVHYLEHADSEELAATLSSLSSGTPARRRPRTPTRSSTTATRATTQTTPTAPASIDIFQGEIRIAPDAATNSLVITASGQDYEALKAVIAKLDIPRPQVFVEALIMEVNMTKGLDVGLAGSGGKKVAGTDENPSILAGGTQWPGTVPLSSVFGLGAMDVSKLTGMAVGLQGQTIDIPGTELSLPIYGAVFRAFQSDGIFNILSTPNILTTDNKEAEIIIGSEVPIVTQQQQAVTSVSTTGVPNILNQIERKEVATKLKVTPQINESDFVTLDIFQEISEVDESTKNDPRGPTTSTRSAKTTVVVQDSQTVVIGGLIRDKISKSVGKVPILGDIPLIGLLFRRTTRDINKINLMIFITPHIVHRPMDLQRITVDQNKRRRRFNKRHNIQEHPAVKSYGIDKSVDFNSVRPRRVKPKSRVVPKKRSYERKRSYDEDTDDEGTEVESMDRGEISRRKPKRTKSQFTRIEMNEKPERTTYDDDSFFKEESTNDELNDSDYISDELYYENGPKATKKKRKKRKGSDNPFTEIQPPSSE